MLNGDMPFEKVMLMHSEDGELCAKFIGPGSLSLMVPVTELSGRLCALRKDGERAPLTEEAIQKVNELRIIEKESI